jgi:methylglutaconyl-CoA hydratase
MSEPNTIRLLCEGNVARLVLARPGVRNAFDETMIAELRDALRRIEADRSARVLLLEAEGTVFCAGADLNWMKRSAQFTAEENLQDALALADLLDALDRLPQPTVARVQGPALGGGVGVVAACDIVVAAEDAFFALSEVRLGLAPAVISPYVARRIGSGPARHLFLTAERIPARRALELGLVSRVVAAGDLDTEVEDLLKTLLQGGPRAQAACKELIRVAPSLTGEERDRFTAQMISDLRAGEEGQEGLRAFLERRSPAWRAER